MKNALNNQVGMLGDMFLWVVANLKQGVIYFIKQALPPNISAGSVYIENINEIDPFSMYSLASSKSSNSGHSISPVLLLLVH